MATDAMKTEHAKEIYKALCAHLDDIGLKYTRHDDDLVIVLTMHGDDLPIEMLLRVDADRQVLSLLSPLRPKMPEDKRIEAAVAVSVATYGMVFGSFDYDISDGEIRFRAVIPFRDGGITKDQVEYLVMVSAGTIDRYNDKFLMLNKGLLTLEQFVDAEKKD